MRRERKRNGKLKERINEGRERGMEKGKRINEKKKKGRRGMVEVRRMVQEKRKKRDGKRKELSTSNWNTKLFLYNSVLQKKKKENNKAEIK